MRNPEKGKTIIFVNTNYNEVGMEVKPYVSHPNFKRYKIREVRDNILFVNEEGYFINGPDIIEIVIIK